jgi:hypothetical protein
MNHNIIDVRDVAEAQLRIAESAAVRNGDRYNLVRAGLARIVALYLRSSTL